MLLSGVMRYSARREKVGFIVPERIREAVESRALSYEKAAELCGVPVRDFKLMANGHKEVPQPLVFDLSKAFDFPPDFFFYLKWERV